MLARPGIFSSFSFCFPLRLLLLPGLPFGISTGPDGKVQSRTLGYAGIAVAYAIAAIIIFGVIPGNPDPLPEFIPEALVIMFRTFSIIGHALLWMTIGLGVAGYIRYRGKGLKGYRRPDGGARTFRFISTLVPGAALVEEVS